MPHLTLDEVTKKSLLMILQTPIATINFPVVDFGRLPNADEGHRPPSPNALTQLFGKLKRANIVYVHQLIRRHANELTMNVRQFGTYSLRDTNFIVQHLGFELGTTFDQPLLDLLDEPDGAVKTREASVPTTSAEALFPSFQDLKTRSKARRMTPREARCTRLVQENYEDICTGLKTLGYRILG